jgi:hypothetical protein
LFWSGKWSFYIDIERKEEINLYISFFLKWIWSLISFVYNGWMDYYKKRLNRILMFVILLVILIILRCSSHRLLKKKSLNVLILILVVDWKNTIWQWKQQKRVACDRCHLLNMFLFLYIHHQSDNYKQSIRIYMIVIEFPY